MLFVLTSYIRQKEIMRRKKEKDWIFSFSTLFFVIVTLSHHYCLLASPLLVSLNAENEYDNKYDPYYPVKIVCKLPKILSRILHNFLYLNCLTSFIYKAERDYEKEKRKGLDFLVLHPSLRCYCYFATSLLFAGVSSTGLS